jgi:hypothetical protein
LLAHVLVAKYGLHLPLNRQSTTYAREGIDLDVSTLADWVGACAATLMPLVEAIRTYAFAAKRIHADDTTAPSDRLQPQALPHPPPNRESSTIQVNQPQQGSSTAPPDSTGSPRRVQKFGRSRRR